MRLTTESVLDPAAAAKVTTAAEAASEIDSKKPEKNLGRGTTPDDAWGVQVCFPPTRLCPEQYSNF